MSHFVLLHKSLSKIFASYQNVTHPLLPGGVIIYNTIINNNPVNTTNYVRFYKFTKEPTQTWSYLEIPKIGLE